MLSEQDRAAWNRWVGLSRRLEGDERLPTARIVVAVDEHIRALEAVAKAADVIACNAMLPSQEEQQGQADLLGRLNRIAQSARILAANAADAEGLAVARCLVNRGDLAILREALAAEEEEEAGRADR